MRKMIDFNEYLLTQIFEEMDLKIKELELILSPRLIKILKEMNHQIADDLLEYHSKSKREFKMTFVDLGTEAGTVSFIQSNKVPELVEPELVHGDYTKETEVIPAPPYKGRGPKPKDQKNWIGGYFDYIQSYKNPWISDTEHLVDLHDDQFKSKDHPVWTKFRAETPIGRFISTLFPKKYVANVKKDILDSVAKPYDVESFSNMFKATVEAHSKIIKMVEGDNIVFYYNCNNYAKEGGTLGNSCMNHPSKGVYLGLYSKNPEKVKMLVLYPEDVRDKIIGRAILWKLDTPNRYFMDRIYTANDSDQYLFIEYAKSHGYLYKSSQSYGWDYDIIDGKTGDRSKIEMSINLPGDYDYYPYLDTLQFFNPETGHLTNDYNNISSRNYRQLTDTQGGSNSF
jgi:hypothetical protein